MAKRVTKKQVAKVVTKVKQNNELKSTKNVRSLPDVANYDLHPDYHYSAYWDGREYEHKAELYAISGLLKKAKRNRKMGSILDLGAGFGRLFPGYCKHFDKIVLGDYSTKELQDALNYIKSFSCPKRQVNMYALNAYFLPFKTHTFDFVISVRVIHHIERVSHYLREVYRVIQPQGCFVLEVANKDHIKARIRALLSGNFKFFKKKRILVGHNKTSSQGLVTHSQKYVFYNYKISYIIKQAEALGFSVKGVRQVSILRSPFLKKVLPQNIMLFVEKMYQQLSGVLSFLHIYLTPSVFLLLCKNSKGKNSSFKDIEEQLVCPQHQKVRLQKNTNGDYVCQKGCVYKKKNNIYDLRFPIITV